MNSVALNFSKNFMDSQTKKQIQDFISNAKYEKAVGAFIAWADVNGDSDLQNALRMKKGELSTLKNDINMGMVDSRDEGVRRNKIVAGLLGMLSDAEDMVASLTTSPVSTQPVNTPIIVATVNNNANNGLKTILFMGANPPGVRAVQLETEHSRISTKLNDANGRPRFNMPTAMFLSADQIPELFVQYTPYLVHFSGHGKNPDSGEHGEEGAGMSRAIGRIPTDYAQRGGIVTFSDDRRDLQIIDDEVIEFLFATTVNDLGIKIEVVVFNSCYSESQAKVIGKYVPYVVGTANAIKDETAIAFASGFYFGLAVGLTVEKAYATGRMQAVIKDIKAKDLIVLYKNGERQKLWWWLLVTGNWLFVNLGPLSINDLFLLFITVF